MRIRPFKTVSKRSLKKLHRGIHPHLRILWSAIIKERMSIKKLAKKAGICHNTIHDWLNYRCENPNIFLLDQCLEVVDLTTVVIPREWLNNSPNFRSITDVKTLARILERAKALESRTAQDQTEETVEEEFDELGSSSDDELLDVA